jgi:hypothetical protein
LGFLYYEVEMSCYGGLLSKAGFSLLPVLCPYITYKCLVFPSQTGILCRDLNGDYSTCTSV